MQARPIKNIQLHLYPKALIRTPQFHLGADLYESWEALKTSISYASPEFYERIKDSTAEQLDKLPDTVLQTVHKYFNRARYRSTPFGSFAGISLLDLTGDTEGNSIQVEPSLLLHHFPDWAALSQSATVTQQELKPDSLLIANSSHYPCDHVLRYLSKKEERYQLCEIANTPIVRDILGHCKTAISYIELMDRLCSPSVKKRQLISLIKEMIAAHLLLNASGPGIIGDHPKAAGNSSKNTYIIAERKIHSCKLNAKAFANLPELIRIMSRIKPQQNPPALTDFIQNFLIKFGTEEIPLLKALDPDQGIGYAGLEHSLDQSELVNILFKQNQQSKEPEQQLKETLLSRLIIAATSQVNPLRLEDIAPAGTGLATPTLPNSLSVLVSVLGDHICISSLGGCTANALMGRFSIASPQIEDYCRKIACLEQQANPEVIFFDISYTGEKNTGNINRRAAIYPHQLNILNPGSLGGSIPINELLVCVRDGELILSSVALGKRVVPRMASAYNYLRSELPLFRLLCDLQHQGIQSSPIIELEQLLPGLPHYPRFSYKNIIISPEKWKIRLSELQHMASGSSYVYSLKKRLTELGTSRYLKAGLGDQTLRIDTDNDADLQLLSRHLHQVKECYVQEDLTAQNSIVKDIQDQAYHHELLLTYTHHQQIYPGYSPKKSPLTISNQRIIAPGLPWLYFELYCQPGSADAILSIFIPALLEAHKKDISQWFFMRYSENGHHIRFRLKLHRPDSMPRIIQKVYQLLDTQIQSGMISEVLIKPYRPELQRYGAEQTSQVESHFHVDSELVHLLILLQLTDQQKYLLSKNTMEQIQESGLIEQQSYYALIQKSCDAFLREHQVSSSGYKSLNAAFKSYANSRPAAQTYKVRQAHRRFCQSLIRTLYKYTETARGRVLADLMHMHFNRLFSHKQRSHELIFYYFQLKSYQREQAAKSPYYSKTSRP